MRIFLIEYFQYLLRMSMILCKYNSLTKFLTIINLNSIPHQYIQNLFYRIFIKYPCIKG